MHAHVTRPYSHSLSDDEKLYRSAAELEADAQRDPIPKFGLFLVREGILDEKELEALEASADQEIIAATDRAPPSSPRKESLYALDLFAGCGPNIKALSKPEPAFSGEVKTMVEMVPATLADEMERDARIVVFGEDVADCSREENLAAGEGEGRRLQGHRRPAAADTARRLSTRRWPKPISSAAPSAWPCAD